MASKGARVRALAPRLAEFSELSPVDLDRAAGQRVWPVRVCSRFDDEGIRSPRLAAVTYLDSERLGGRADGSDHRGRAGERSVCVLPANAELDHDLGPLLVLAANVSMGMGSRFSHEYGLSQCWEGVGGGFAYLSLRTPSPSRNQQRRRKQHTKRSWHPSHMWSRSRSSRHWHPHYTGLSDS